ncbi:MAG: hypothetical protein NTY01_09105 [Verrucomicrobia bacterium]|nr:hypothetical protein [Verrucomicrobiota bacterium]
MDPLNNLPQFVKWGAGAAGAAGLLAMSFLMRSGVWFALCILLLFAVVIGGFTLVLWWRRRLQGEQFALNLNEQGTGAPRDVSAAEQRAKLDDLRKKFQEGLREYESRGKNIYSLPWYMMVGEPGSGKTEAIRHSEVGFPPGLNEFMQGVGGTINMNWWFTNKAVLLDTAGRLMFEQVRSGETSEWREFLKLLRRTRPNCPINGLFLAIPVDTLIKDTADQIGEKAQQIAKQLEVIQSVLDVRFPVFVLVTKCDLAIGFREFFDSIKDPVLQHQMIGWSNPEDLDSPFKPALVAEHLQTVAARLERRRLSMLRDPAPQKEGGRRLSEVDQMYALPTSISKTIAGRLEHYLSLIFEQGEWSAKPVFLRGIYFTSSMREGSALDADLAEALGVSVSDLPPTRAFEKERAFFLRDLFMAKAFQEAGLVTRATNAGRLIKRRQMIFFGVATLALAALGTFSWFGMRDLNRTVREETPLWRAAQAADSWDRGVWMPIVVPQAGASRTYRYRGDETFGSGKTTYLEFHATLRDRASKPVEVGWVFRPISSLAPSADLNRRDPQRIMFERGVLYPLVNAVRQKMRQDEGQTNTFSSARQTLLQEALVSLLRLEKDGTDEQHILAGASAAEEYLKAWLSYVTGTSHVVNTNLVAIMDWTYSAQGGGFKKWPPAWLLGGESLARNTAIERGLQQYFKGARIGQLAVIERLKLVEQMRAAASAFHAAERKLYSDIQAFQQRPGAREVKLEELNAVESAKKALDQALDTARQAKLFQGDVFQLGAAYNSLLAEGRASSKEAMAPLSKALPQGSRLALFGEVGRQLDAQQSGGLVDQIQQSADADKGMAELDAAVLSATRTAFAYRQRWDSLYQAAVGIYPRQNPVFNDIFGREWVMLADLREKRKGFDARVVEYQGPWRREALAICDYFLAKGEESLREKWIGDYARQAEQALASTPLADLNTVLGKLEKDLSPALLKRLFETEPPKLKELREKMPTLCARRIEERLKQLAVLPLVADASGRSMTLEELRGAWSFLQDCVKAVELPLLRDTAEIKALRDRIHRYDATARAVLADDGAPLNCAVILDAGQDLLTTFTYRAIELEVGGKSLGVVETTSGKDRELGKVSLEKDVAVHVRLFKQAPSVGDSQLPNWALLRLLMAGKDAVQRDAQGRTWRVKLPVPAAGSKQQLSLRLEFDRPLPELEQWAKP